jgi:uncharacterized protein YciI
MEYLCLTYDVVPDYLERRVPLRPEHLSLAVEYALSGELRLGGAVGDPATGALLVFRSSRARVEAFVARDPYVSNGLVTRWEVRPWAVVVGMDLPSAEAAWPPAAREVP